METEWKYYARIITTDQSFGTQMAKKAAPFPGDTDAEGDTFNPASALVESGGEQVVAWAAGMICKQSLASAIYALGDDASFDDSRLALLRSRGLTQSQWAYAKTALVADVTDRDVAGSVDEFIASNGYGWASRT